MLLVVHTFFDQTGNTVDETAATFEPIHSHLLTTQLEIACLKLTIEPLEQGVKYVQS